MNWTRASLDSNGINVHYLRTGGDKPPLVLLHGLIANGACWTPLARALEGQFDVVMPDARGHGGSSAPSHGYRYQDHAADVTGLIQGLKLSAPVLLGHSMGGMTAAVVASQKSCRLRAVILVDPTFLTPARQREVFDSDVAEQHRRILGQDKNQILADLQRRRSHRSPELLQLIAAARLQTRMNAFEVLTPPNPEYQELVSRIDVPILMVIADGGVVSTQTASQLQTLNPRIQIEQISDAGHAIQYDQPERFETVVRSYLGMLDEILPRG